MEPAELGGVGTTVEALERRAGADPDAELVRFADGTRVGVGELDAGSRAVAARLAERAEPGASMATCLVPGREAVELIFGLARLGVAEVPLPLDVTAASARAVLTATGARTLVVGADALAGNDRLAELVAEMPDAVVVGAGGPEGIPLLDELPLRPGIAARRTPPEPGTPLAVLSTSGTTGRAKAAVLPHFAAVRHAQRVRATMDYRPGDVLFNVFPWNHINVRHAALLPALLSGARLVAHRRFSASGFWATCRAEEVTAFNFMGVMLAILDRRPPAPEDAAHRVGLAYGAPAPVDLARRFLDRFGVRALEAYACTELGDVAANTPDTWRPGTAGPVVPEYEVAILDENGLPLPPGETGQIAARPRLPDMAFLEYAGDSEATAQVRADGWFRTGDRGRLDADGYLSFAGRRADVVRRRGENVAAWDVERVLVEMPGVLDAAVVGVASELTEQEILAVLTPADGAELTGPAVRDWCRPRLPAHALPRFVRIVPELPRNPNGKVLKAALGVDPETWDAGR